MEGYSTSMADSTKERDLGLDYVDALAYAKAVIRARHGDPIIGDLLEEIKEGYAKVLSGMKRKPLNELIKLQDVPWDPDYAKNRARLTGTIYDTIREANNLINNVRKLERSGPAITEGDILDQLEILSRTYEVEYSEGDCGKSPTLLVTLPERDLLDHNGDPIMKVGPFVLKVPASYMSSVYCERGEVHLLRTPDTHNITTTDYCHPHIKGHRLCVGSYSNILTAAAGAAQIVVFVEQVSICLSYYNSESPHLDVSEWNIGRCVNCESIIQKEEQMKVCPRCNEKYCLNCTAYIVVDGVEYLACKACGILIHNLVLPRNWRERVRFSSNTAVLSSYKVPSILLEQCKICHRLTLNTFMSRSGKCVKCAGGKS